MMRGHGLKRSVRWGRRGAALALCAALSIAAWPLGFGGAPIAAAAGCGATLSIGSADVGAGQTAALAITADTLGPGIAGYQVTVEYDPSIAVVTAIEPGTAFPNFSSNLSDAAQGSVSLSGASAHAVSGGTVLAVLEVKAVAPAGSDAGFGITTASLSDEHLNTPTACSQGVGLLTIVGGPVITGLSPASGPARGGSTVSITGGGFTGATEVSFGQQPAAGFTVVNDSQITATPPAGSGLVNVSVTSPQGTSPASSSSRYTYASQGQTLALGAVPSAVPVGDTARVTAVLLDPQGNPEAGQTVSFTASGSATLSAASAVTGVDGVASVYVCDAQAEAVSLGAQVTTPSGTTSGSAQVSFTAAVTATGSLQISTSTPLGPPTAQLLTVSTPNLSNLTLDMGLGSPLSLSLTTPVGQAATLVGSISASMLSQSQAQSLLGQSSGIRIATTESNDIGAASPIGPIIQVDTTGTAATLFSQNPAATTNPSIQITLPYEASLLGASETPEIVWLDTAESPAVWTNAGVSILEVGDSTVTALLPHLSTLSVVGVSLRASTATKRTGTSTKHTSTAAQTIGSGGGTLATPDGAFELTVPAGALAASGSLSVAETSSVPDGLPTDLSAVSSTFTLTGDTLSAPQTATVQLAAGANTASVSLWAQSPDGSWAYLPTHVDLAAGTASAYVLGPTTLVALKDATQPSDLTPGYWAMGDIDALLAAGLASGFPDGTFRPGAALTRAQFVKLLVLATGGSASAGGASPFKDVSPSDWFAPYVAAAVRAGMVQGTSATTFSPDLPVTREEMATLLARALKLPSSASAPSFSDRGSIATWAASSVSAVAQAGYLEGFPDGGFHPLAPTTRAQAAKVVALLIAHLAP